jgi:MFS family permease
MELRDVILLLHPFVAVVVVFPLIGIVLNRALQTRQRRLQTASGEKSKIPPGVGQEHVQLGRWLTGSVVGIVLLAFAHDIFGHVIDKQLWQKDSFKVILIAIIFAVTIASLALLYRANQRLWRGVFATLAGASLVILGCQDGIYRKTSQWYFSHYYYGITAALLMIFSLAILRDIYQDKTQRWRSVHIILNSIALLIFIAQSFTGAQALLEIPLAWQKPYVQQLYKQQCAKQPCTIQGSPVSPTTP